MRIPKVRALPITASAALGARDEKRARAYAVSCVPPAAQFESDLTLRRGP